MSIVLFIKWVVAYDYKAKLHDPDFDVDRAQAGRSVTAYYNIVCCVCGTGMLSLPSVLAAGGWGALALLLLCWWMVTVSNFLLLYVARKKSV